MIIKNLNLTKMKNIDFEKVISFAVGAALTILLFATFGCGTPQVEPEVEEVDSLIIDKAPEQMAMEKKFDSLAK